jgi:hypothetical protein
MEERAPLRTVRIQKDEKKQKVEGHETGEFFLAEPDHNECFSES